MTDSEDLPLSELTISSEDSTFFAVLYTDGRCFFYNEENELIYSAVLDQAAQDSAHVQAILPIAEQFFNAGEKCGRLQGKWHLAYQIKGLLGIPHDAEDRLTKLENP